MKFIKTLGSVILIMALMFSFSAGAFADNWDLANGQVIISCDDSGVQQVSQNAPPVADSNPVITGEYTGVPLEEGAEAAVYIDTTNGDINVTFDNVTLNNACVGIGSAPNEEGALNDVTVTFAGENKIATVATDASAIGVYDVKNLTIAGADESASLTVSESFEGINISGAENVTIDNMNIKAVDNISHGMEIHDIDNLNIKNSTIDVNSKSNEENNAGILVHDVDKDVNIENSAINVKDTDLGMSISLADNVKIDTGYLGADVDATGFIFSDVDNLSVNNSTINTKADYTGVMVGQVQNATFDNSTVSTDGSEGLLEYSVNNTEFNNCSVDIKSTKTGMQLSDTVNATFTNSSVNVNSDMTGLLLSEASNLNINSSDFSVNAKKFAVILIGDEPSLQLSGSTMTTPKSIHVVTLDVPGVTESVCALSDEYFTPVKEVKIERNPTPAPARTADAEGKSVGESFSFACAESDVKSVSYGGVTLTKGTDYTISTSGGMLKITFTDAFFAAHGNGPHYITINIGGVIYNLTVVRK